MTEQPQPVPSADLPRRGPSGTALLGVILIAAGVVLFVGQQLDIDWAGSTWPFYVIAPGLVLVAFGLTQPHGSGLTIAGSIVTMVGLILLYQNATDHWESWAYAWALAAPGGSGMGMLLYGTRSGNGRMAREGFWQVVTALGILAVGFVFFEGIIGISGDRLPVPGWVMPAVIIGLGVLVLFRGLTSGRGPRDEAPPA